MKILFPLLLLSTVFAFGSLSADYEHEYEDDEDTIDASLPYVEIKAADDLAAVNREARETGKVIMIEMSAPYCSYCRTLEEEIIKPMLRNSDYAERVLIRKLDIESHAPVIDFNGSRTSAAQIARRYGVYVTPTLIFVDADGREASKRILGVNTLEFYGGYVDDALDEAHRKINNPKYVYTTQ